MNSNKPWKFPKYKRGADFSSFQNMPNGKKRREKLLAKITEGCEFGYIVSCSGRMPANDRDLQYLIKHKKVKLVRRKKHSWRCGNYSLTRAIAI